MTGSTDVRKNIMEKILVLGAGNAQIDLIEYCRNAGMEVYCCSYSSSDPGAKLADHFSEIDIIDREKVEKYFRDNQIDYIYSVGSDIAVPVFSAVAERTGTWSFVSSKTAQICCDKSLMRDMLRDKKYNLPSIIGTEPEEVLGEVERQNMWPVEIKPVDSQGQRGITKAGNAEELAEGFRKAMKYSRSGEVILEEYIEGSEVSLNAYLRGGEIIFSVLSDREVWPQYPGGIIHCHHIPSVFEGSDVQRKILGLAEDVVNSMGIHDGPVYFQIMIREGIPYLIEVTPRLDGCHMWRLIREACGTDLLDMTMNHLRYGDPYHTRVYPAGNISVPGERAVHLEFFCQAPGEQMDRSRFSDTEAIYRHFYYKDGEIVKRTNGCLEKCGLRIFREPV